MRQLTVVLLTLMLTAVVHAEVPRIGVIPFVNIAGDPAADAEVMTTVRHELRITGVPVVGRVAIEDFLRKRRVRARYALPASVASDLALHIDARYLMMGTIDTWASDDGPEVGLTARLLDPENGRTIWVGRGGVHAPEERGLINAGRPRTMNEATLKAVHELFADLDVSRGTLRAGRKKRDGDKPKEARRAVAFRSTRLEERDSQKPLRVALLPLSNRTDQPDAPAILGSRLVYHLLRSPDVELIDPGEVRRVLIDEEILPLHGVDSQELARLGQALEIDAVIDGSVLTFSDGPSSRPEIDLFMRLRDAQSGKVLWSATTVRNGNQSRTLYDLGRIRGLDRLADAALVDLLATWLH